VNSIEVFYENLDESQINIIDTLHLQFSSLPEIKFKIRYRVPFYAYQSWISYINPKKSGAVELCFIHGQKLSFNNSLIHARGRKQIAGVLINSPEEASTEAIIQCFIEAVMLDEQQAKS